MVKNNGVIEFIGFAGIILIVVALLNLPHLQIQTKDLQNIYMSSDGKLVISQISVWNRGGTIGGSLLFVPNVCITALVDKNLSCTHQGYKPNNPCEIGVCNTLEPGKISSPDSLYIDLSKNSIDNFTIDISAKGYISFFKIDSVNKILTCNKNRTNNHYDCAEEVPPK